MTIETKCLCGEPLRGKKPGDFCSRCGRMIEAPVEEPAPSSDADNASNVDVSQQADVVEPNQDEACDVDITSEDDSAIVKNKTQPSGLPLMPATVPSTKTMYCSCGQDLHGLRLGELCPGCASPISIEKVSLPLKTAGWATAGLICGIASLVFNCCGCCGGPFGLLVTIPCGILAIVGYLQTKTAVRTHKACSSSMGIALAGLICGIIGMVCAVMMLVLFAIGIITG